MLEFQATGAFFKVLPSKDHQNNINTADNNNNYYYHNDNSS